MGKCIKNCHNPSPEQMQVITGSLLEEAAQARKKGELQKAEIEGKLKND